MVREQSTKDMGKKLIFYRKEKKLVKYLILKLKETLNNLQEFNDFFGGLMKEDPSFIVNQIYYDFREKASKILSFDDMKEIDKYIMGNYTNGEREHLITSFKGNLERVGAFFEGNLLLTNLRMAGIGTVKRNPWDRAQYMAGYAIGGLIGAAITSSFLKDKQQKGDSIGWALERDMKNTFSEEALSKFKHNFPIINAYDIKKSITNLSYFVKLKYEHEFGIKAIRFIVTPLQEKLEKRGDFYTRRQEVLNRIEETLINTQLLKDYETENKPNILYLMRVSKELNENGEEVIIHICANCGEKNNFTERVSNIFQCLKCGAGHHIRE
ncbi:hypothetical protein LCGC14_0473830 [marine sediment metagenome]|uniref:Uncharacterized protein n=1 Tax=marine sediment metagenome TaxID=412755 RepID=A0A0F9VK30_9ZZZZ|nr:hypothetical protein [bacterium]